ncbi:3-oxoacyl-[acyl-carrier-protein] reductase FabG [Manduca sexta]|nr:3-oxoacyl-[acyl-carrier-protein] reductase FabG [Manduca sexta]
MCFHDKVVLITGASSGIGAACSLKFAKSSALLSLIGRNEENLTNTANKCEELSGLKPLIIVADITMDEDVQRIVSETINRYGQIDVLINNAGVSSIEGIQKEMDAYDHIMATNARGTYHLTNEVIPYLIKTKGNIINISSILSMKPLPIMTAYCMSKAAIDMATKCLALKLGSTGVRVNAVNPGPVKTDMFKRSGLTEEGITQMLAAVEMNAPLKKITQVENVAELVKFLASDKANCVTGCCYVIDCGISLGDDGKY